MSIILFLFILTALVFVHELGHFIVAKLSGVRVDEFAIGFPPRIFSFKYGETLYTINLIPFGGFVKIFGENPDEESLKGPQSERSFVRKSYFTQALILLAGVAFNVLFGWILISSALNIGLPAPYDSLNPSLVKNPAVSVIEVLALSPAEKAGFKSGDKIIYLETEEEKAKADSAEQVRSFIGAHPEEEITFSIERKNQKLALKAVASADIEKNRKAVGISLADIGIMKLTVGEALIEGAKKTFISTGLIAVGLFDFIKSAVLGEADIKQVTGPIGIVGLVGDASDLGLAYLLNFTAFISINLAVINILPIPALDGGRLLIVGVEAIRKRPLNYKYVNIINATGFILLIILMLLITYQDIARLFSN